MAFGRRSGRGIFNPKGGSSRARAQRARKGHAKRRARNLSTFGGEHYRGSPSRRTRGSWLF